MAKSASFGVMHLGMAFSASFALTGSVAVAGAMMAVEPAVNAVAHDFFDHGWVRRGRTRPVVVAAWQRGRG